MPMRHPGFGSPRSLSKKMLFSQHHSPLLGRGHFSLLRYNKDQSFSFKFLDFKGFECLRQAAFMILNPEFSVYVVAHVCCLLLWRAWAL